MSRPVKTPAKPWNTFFVPSRRSMKSAFEKGKSRTLRLRISLQAMTRRWGSFRGSGRKSTALVTLNMAVLAPTPKIMVNIAVSAKMEFFLRVRPANTRSRKDIVPPHQLCFAKNTLLSLRWRLESRRRELENDLRPTCSRLANIKRRWYPPAVEVKSCRVTISDMEDVAHSVEVTAATL